MADKLQTYASHPAEPRQGKPPEDGCLLVIFGATGDLTKRLLTPALYNLACDKLLPEHFAIVGLGRTTGTTEAFREQLTEDIKKFSTRSNFDEAVWQQFLPRLHYGSLSFDDLQGYRDLAGLLEKLAEEFQTSGNILFYLATPPSLFGTICEKLHQAGFTRTTIGWRRII